jgi:hypothetical protein
MPSDFAALRKTNVPASSKLVLTKTERRRIVSPSSWGRSDKRKNKSMGISKRLKRRKRRQQRARCKPRHRLIGGRTGSKRHKQRAGMLIELNRQK